jgi:hypothetical protein
MPMTDVSSIQFRGREMVFVDGQLTARMATAKPWGLVTDVTGKFYATSGKSGTTRGYSWQTNRYRRVHACWAACTEGSHGGVKLRAMKLIVVGEIVDANGLVNICDLRVRQKLEIEKNTYLCQDRQ